MTHDNARSGIIITGIVLIAASVLVPLVVWSINSGSWEGIAGAIVFTVIFAPLLFIAGLITLIVGIAKGRGGQQQQQQVVFMDRSEAQAHGFVQQATCPHCSGKLGGAENFCIHCGRRVTRG